MTAEDEATEFKVKPGGNDNSKRREKNSKGQRPESGFHKMMMIFRASVDPDQADSNENIEVRWTPDWRSAAQTRVDSRATPTGTSGAAPWCFNDYVLAEASRLFQKAPTYYFRVFKEMRGTPVMI